MIIIAFAVTLGAFVAYSPSQQYGQVTVYPSTISDEGDWIKIDQGDYRILYFRKQTIGGFSIRRKDPTTNMPSITMLDGGKEYRFDNDGPDDAEAFIKALVKPK